MNKQWFRAAEEGDVGVILELLDRGEDVNAVGHDEGDRTALMLAVMNRRHELIRVLLDRGASIEIEDGFGLTAVTYACFLAQDFGSLWPPATSDPRPLEMLLASGGRLGLREAVMSGDVELARARLDEGADVDLGTGTYHGTMLQTAAERGDVAMVNLLLDRGANIESTDDCSMRPLEAAARSGRVEVVRSLLDRGAEIDAGGCYGTPLQAAARFGETEVVRLLLDLGAEIDEGIENGNTPLADAAQGGHREVVDLLLARGAGRSMLDSIALNEVELVERFLRNVDDVDDVDDHHYSYCDRLAMIAAHHGHPEVLRLFLDRGAVHLREELFHNDDGKIYDRHPMEPHSLLAEAAKCGHADAVRLLIARGADMHAVGSDELTPLAWAQREGRGEVVRILEEAGATR